GFLTGAIAARTMGPAGFAVYTVGLTIYSSLMQATSFSDTWLVSRWTSEPNKTTLRRTVWKVKVSISIALVISACILAVFFPSPIRAFGIDGRLLVIAVLAA